MFSFACLHGSVFHMPGVRHLSACYPLKSEPEKRPSSHHKYWTAMRPKLEIEQDAVKNICIKYLKIYYNS